MIGGLLLLQRVRANASGERTLRTKGDANDAVDPRPVRPAQVRGEVWYAVPHLGRIEGLLTGRRLASPVAAGDRQGPGDG